MNRLPDLSRLRYFVAVAEALSFREAAGRLNVAQPAVSRAVQQLEAEIGFKLFERTTRRVTLTPAGAVLAREANAALQQLQRAVRDASQVAAGDAGELVIGYSAQATHGPMAEIIIRFRSAYPNAQVSLYSLSSQEQLPAIEAGTIDLGFLLSAACKPPLRHVVVARQRFVVLVSRQNPLAKHASVSLRELAGTPFVIGTPKRWLSFRGLITNVCLGAGFVPDIAEEADDVPLLLQLVSLGRGVTLYGSAITPMLQPDIVAVPISDEHAGFDISIAWHESRQTRLATEFIAFAQAASTA
ncbi:MAG: LysR family transcriptional regulator [Phreatobacter sp.]